MLRNVLCQPYCAHAHNIWRLRSCEMVQGPMCMRIPSILGCMSLRLRNGVVKINEVRILTHQ